MQCGLATGIESRQRRTEGKKTKKGLEDLTGEKCESKAIPIFSKSYIGDLYDDLNNLTELVLLVSKVIVEFGGCGQKEKCWKGIKEFEDIGMKVFFQNLYSDSLNYYCNIHEYGSSDTEDTKCGITDTHTFGFGENSYTLFLCMRVKKVIGYFRIDIDKQKDRESTNSIKFSEHKLYLQNEPQFQLKPGDKDPRFAEQSGSVPLESENAEQSELEMIVQIQSRSAFCNHRKGTG